MQRRRFLRNAALIAGGTLLSARLSFAQPDTRKSRFVLVILRGALDGLAAVPPLGDHHYAQLRREFALHPPGEVGGALQLNGFFGLHPALVFLHECYAARELIVLHALASPYRERSHFDGQDVLENGTTRPHALQTGWLNRALAALPAPGGREAGVSLGQNVPLVMRGPAAVTSWSPSKLVPPDDDTLARITDLYAGDPLLAARLADALAADAIAAGAHGTDSMTAPGTAAGSRSKARYAEVVRAAGGFLRREEGPKVAVFDTSGWDTHANEGGAQGQLAGRLAELDAGLAALRQELGPAWRDTAVLLLTEFGRTAAVNGTRGTDHGTATAAFLLGGAVAGGRVVADWPGLSPRELYQGRDLAPTLDVRSVLKGVLAEQLAVPAHVLELEVFPDSAAARALRGLMRA
ncbi:MAG TPA: DUF1501 domain-containing protein [Steroidobacteraceae bacterium]|nr:DUF1501 domain-containing protein [Steroidobacteraceae bacterium]